MHDDANNAVHHSAIEPLDGVRDFIGTHYMEHEVGANLHMYEYMWVCLGG